ncbi:hypothetical protein [Amorphus sp. 3PC139-8]|uniref:hypothetical protein n=1 Tax=Amorphus sp. 3PC139-8 TaxID=2735676 RepID=UPI00345D07B9
MPKITKVGNSYGVVLSRETLAAANMKPNDEVVIGTGSEGLVIAPRHSRRGQIIAAMNQRMDDDADVFRILAS